MSPGNILCSCMLWATFSLFGGMSNQNQSSIAPLMNTYDVFSDIIKDHLLTPDNVCKKINNILNTHEDYITTRTKAHIYSHIKNAYHQIPGNITNYSMSHLRHLFALLFPAYKHSWDFHGMHHLDYLYLMWLKGELSTAAFFLHKKYNNLTIKYLEHLKPKLYTNNTLSKLNALHDTLSINENYKRITLCNKKIQSIVHKHGYQEWQLSWYSVVRVLLFKLYAHVLNDTAVSVEMDWYHHFNWVHFDYKTKQMAALLVSEIALFRALRANLFRDLNVREEMSQISSIEMAQQMIRIENTGAGFVGGKYHYHAMIVDKFKKVFNNPIYNLHRFGGTAPAQKLSWFMNDIESIHAYLSYGIKLSIYDCGDVEFRMMNDLVTEIKKLTSNKFHEIILFV
eukprot:987199_1